MVELTDFAADLAKEYQVPVLFMVERLSDLAGNMSKYPSLYSDRSGRFTDSGAKVASHLIAISCQSGKLVHQLTAWSAQ